MDELLLARLQFGVTTVYHFIFVPVTIGLSLLVALLQTAWVRTGREHYKRATKFWGKLFLINFALGLVTGIVQEFQFGMNWSDYSRFVGDIFGAPLAIEALLAFFLESTFLGIWIFGWGKLPKLVHLGCIWLVAIGTTLSAYFILAANSWMQNPVGYTFNEQAQRAELTSFTDVLTNKVLLWAFPHTISGCLVTGGLLMAAVAAWHLKRQRNLDTMRSSLRLGLAVTLIGTFGFFLSGDQLGKVMTETQPMKMAAAEALYETSQPASFSLFTIGTLDGTAPTFSIEIPDLLSFLATGTLDGEVKGINDLQAQYEAQFGPGDYRPYIPITYWGFRIMVTAGMLIGLVTVVGLWLTRKGRLPTKKWVWTLAIWSVVLPFVGNAFGWIFTEMGRQPWLVFGLLKTEDGVSPTVPGGTVLTSLLVFTALYGILAVVELGLMIRFARKDPPEEPKTPDAAKLEFAY
ncbi:cytochrome ubiquinol oxidase subunit I [Actinocorallia sp. A-T 12471]|uniref:cytochrome ubiquinol oxidase subunit I n=1 Tax=Actinocorallia sp. A-T 12471 TaxID=3089813 RepID=UPI0029CAE5E4|nr:cytochrome ubiquinol oxidase subunit I [Actinocorallia sp. A-T 12471]MDX6738876.1 cytochrome ubiquinol oxidase subunit I [Actinocorallia sp. A-T 12471]